MKNNPEINKGKEIYDKRWKKSIKSGDYDILSTSKLENQVQFFYNKYCQFILGKIIETFPNKKIKDLKVLEVGCGRGTASIYLSKFLKCKVIGIDFSDVSIEIAKKNAKYHKVKAEFIVADIFEKDPLKKSLIKSNEFDVIISLGVLEHIELIDKCFQIHNELLVDDGLFCAMIVPEKNSIQDKFAFVNRALIFWNKILTPNTSKDLDYLDSKSLSKTTNVYRSYESAYYFREKLKKAKFTNVYSVESNPFPTIRPLFCFLENILVLFYKLIAYIYFRIFRKSLFFGCHHSISRCHFLLGEKTSS